MRYQEQLERVRRYYERFTKLDSGIEAWVPTDNYIDDVYAFFQNCYHLKDWLKRDPAFKAPEDVEKFVTKTPCLALCADICNATKHLGLGNGHPPRSGHEPKFRKREFKVEFAAGKDKMSCKVTVEHDGTNLDAYTLATECLQEWEEFVMRA